MTHSQSALVVLVDAEDVRHAFASWPDEICLAACLLRNGDCIMVVFRRNERPYIAERILDVLRLAPRDVCFVPHVPGFETRPFRYSDERRLMALVASDPTVLDEAIDYAVNYTYALEEGLDPAMVLGLKPRTQTAAKAAPKPVQHSTPAPAVDRKATGELSPLLPEFLRKSAEHARRPKFASVRKPKLGALAAQY